MTGPSTLFCTCKSIRCSPSAYSIHIQFKTNKQQKNPTQNSDYKNSSLTEPGISHMRATLEKLNLWFNVYIFTKPRKPQSITGYVQQEFLGNSCMKNVRASLSFVFPYLSVTTGHCHFYRTCALLETYTLVICENFWSAAHILSVNLRRSVTLQVTCCIHLS